jgi:hypothetical protein
VQVQLSATGIAAIAAVGALALVGLWVWRKGPAEAGAAVVGAAAQIADGAASAAVGGVGQVFGLPTPSQTVTEAEIGRYVIDQLGYWQASKWLSAAALARAWALPEGSGKPPPPGAPVWAALNAPRKAPLPADAAELPIDDAPYYAP